MNTVRAFFMPFLPILITLLSLCISSAAALDKPARLTAVYDAGRDQVVVRWNAVPTAGSYRVTLKDGAGRIAATGVSSTLVKKFPGNKFDTPAEYRVQVQAVKGSSSSRASSGKYVHTLSRGEGKGKLLATNSFGRSGNFYLPGKFSKKPLPLMVGFHGQGGAGDSIVNAFANLAEKHGFIIVAPSSGLVLTDIPAWEIELGGAPTADFNHIRNCIEELESFVDVRIDTERILAVGYSAGGAVAPYFATNVLNTEFTHFGVLHGGVVFDTLGPRIIPAWLSTGSTDPLRPPAELQGYRETLEASGFNATYTEYETAHGLTKGELRGVVEWWLAR